MHGIRATALRLTDKIGPRMRIKDARQTFLGVWVRRRLEGEPVEGWGGEQRRDFTYVDDAVEAFLLAAANEAAVGEVFNLGGPPPVTLRALAELMIEENGGGAMVVREFPADRKKIDIGTTSQTIGRSHGCSAGNRGRTYARRWRGRWTIIGASGGSTCEGTEARTLEK